MDMNKPLRIAVNTRLLIKDKLEGIGRFSLEILSRMVANHPEHEFIFIFDRPYHEKFIFAPNVQAVVVGPQARHPFLFYAWFEFSIPYILKKYNADIFISPDGYLSLRSRIPSIGVMHDLNFEHYPKDLPPLILKYYKYFFPRFAHKAAEIITVSEFSKQDIHEHYQIDLNHIHVVYNAVNEVYKPINEKEKMATKEKYTDGADYFLYVGALHQRKNLVSLFKAFDVYKEKFKNEHKLFIVGNKMWWTDQIKTTYEQMKFKDEVIFHPHMSTLDLKHVYGAALALTYLSYFEGFGIPLVESFACGTPVIAGNATSLPEVAADAAFMVEPFDIESIANAMNQVVVDEALRKKLIEKGFKRHQDFDWNRSAEKFWNIIQKVIDDHAKV